MSDMSETETLSNSTPEQSQSNLVFIEENEDFEQLYDSTLTRLVEQEITVGKIMEVSKDYAFVDIGYKSRGLVPVQEFLNEDGVIVANVGDDVEVYVEALESEDGVTILSKDKAVKLRVWETIGQLHEEGGVVRGTIIARIKGGLSVDIGVKAFLPGSQVDLRPVRNLDKLLGEKFEFRILKFNQKRGNIVLSRRALLEVDREERRKKTLEILREGALIKGHVKNITDYGVFIDLGGVDGLLHITDITWGRIVHPSEMFAMGDEVEVMVLKYDADDQKVSLGLKQKSANPWNNVAEKYPVGTRIGGKIVSLTDYGAFIELEPGVEGLIHVSEMSWTKKIRHPSKVVQLNDVVEAVVKELDVERKRISLSMKEALPNPWKLAMERYPVGSVVTGKVRNVTDFGIFVGLEEGIDGLVHISDISWGQRQRKPSEFTKKGDEIEVKILNIDVDQERLSLGIKQLTEDPWKNLDEKFPLNSEVTGRVVNLTDFGIFVEVIEGVEGLVHISEVDTSIPKGKLAEFYPVGTTVMSRVIKIDPEERRLGLSILEIVGAVVPPVPVAAPVEEQPQETSSEKAAE
ncbi:MAG: 30S ribosomal protein S1 [SAR324 cluster bacterium]|nr:30S ribosomal protein S1 [SAR324 cluster bacterium]